MAEFNVTPGTDQRKVPTRLLFVQGEARPTVEVNDEPMVMTFPHLLLREFVAFLALSVGLVLLSVFFDAPLEEIANPERTPNPAKAPWYFLGLQELLHYYPPVVSGVLLPGLLIFALAIVPYFRINLERRPMSEGGKNILAIVWSVVVVLTLVFYFTAAQPAWPLIGPLWVMATLATVGHFVENGTVGAWLHTRSAPFWIFSWFLMAAVVLTVIGLFFRGPGWSFTLPWRDGVFQ